MAKLQLTKTIEATKLHKRTGVPLGEPPVTIPFGAMIENPAPDRDMVNFTCLGEPYQCPEEVFRVATAPSRAAVGTAAADTAAPPAESAGAVQSQMVRWEGLTSDLGQLMRAKVPGGWLVLRASALTFYPDPEHTWEGTSLP